MVRKEPWRLQWSAKNGRSTESTQNAFPTIQLATAQLATQNCFPNYTTICNKTNMYIIQKSVYFLHFMHFEIPKKPGNTKYFKMINNFNLFRVEIL